MSPAVEEVLEFVAEVFWGWKVGERRTLIQWAKYMTSRRRSFCFKIGYWLEMNDTICGNSTNLIKMIQDSWGGFLSNIRFLM